MKLAGKNILLVSPELWDHVFVSKHHYAVHLAKRGNRVFFLNPPTGIARITPSDYPSLSILDYTGFFPGLRHLPTVVRKWLTQRIFKHLEQLADVRFDVIWSFDNSVFFQLDALPARVFKISHLVDLNQNFELATSGRTADLVLVNTSAIGKRFDGLGIRTHFINHGLHVGSTQLNRLFTEPSTLNVGYAGNLDIQYLDWTLIHEVIARHSDVHFHFAGSATKPTVRSYLESTPNIRWHGKLASDELPAFFDQMDVLILAYSADNEPDQLANPHKVLEYLHSGKPIVATYTAEYADKDLLYMSQTNVEWPRLFAEVIANLNDYSAPELVKKRQDFALDNTYDKQIERIERLTAHVT